MHIADNLTTFMCQLSWNLGVSTSWNPQGLSRPVMGWLYLYKCNIEARSRKHCCHGEAISITYSECVSVALVFHHAKRMRPVISSSSACLTLPYVPTLYHKWHNFRKNNIEHKNVFWFSLQVLSAACLILKRNQQDITINVHMSSCKVPVILVKF